MRSQPYGGTTPNPPPPHGAMTADSSAIKRAMSDIPSQLRRARLVSKVRRSASTRQFRSHFREPDRYRFPSLCL